MMHGPEKSDFAIVATKPANKAGRPAVEQVERRAGAGRNVDQQNMRRTQNREACHRRWTACDKPRPFVACRHLLLVVGAGCLNWARLDLCGGGRPVMAVPTANIPERSSSA
jgi:hypothetical protein